MENNTKNHQPLNPLQLALISVLVGVLGGFGAVAFRVLMALFHNIFFLGKFSIVYVANTHTPVSPWGAFIIFVPMVAAVGVAFLVTKFAPEARGHGIPEVIDSIYYNRGIIRPIVAIIKAVASALSIGSGGSVGREGPMMQVGSSIGSTLGQLIPMATWQRITLVGAGTAAGIAATFNTPIGGLLFAVEIGLHEVSVRTMVPVAIATATATYISQAFFGVYPAFFIPKFQTHFFHLSNPLLLGSYFILGIVTGICSALYIHSIYVTEDFFENKIPGNYYVRHMLGMLLVGVLIYCCMVFLGHYYIEGTGYAAIQDVLTGNMSLIYLFVILFVLKLAATSLTLGSGASGGIFSPAFFLGAMAGGAFGVVLKTLFPFFPISPPAFAVAGMAGVVGGSTGAALTALVMAFEMTMDYNAILPLTITIAVSNGVRAFLSRETIYTLKLARRGHFMPNALQTNFHYLKKAESIMKAPISLPATMKIDDFARIALNNETVSHYLVEEEKCLAGTVSREGALEVMTSKALLLEDIADNNYIAVSKDAPLFEILHRMYSGGAMIALVVTEAGPISVDDVLGLISKEQIAEILEEGISMYDD